MEVQEAIAQADLFRGVEEERLLEVATFCDLRKYDHREIIVTEDEVSDRLFLLVRGRAVVEVSFPTAGTEDDSVPCQIGSLKEGDVIGEITLIDNARRSATVRAAGSAEVLSIANEDMRSLLERSPEVGLRVMENIALYLASRLRDSNMRLRNAASNLLF
ncbi:cyclic nucleotide-binding domain-containing protein [Planctomycetota bacterium]